MLDPAGGRKMLRKFLLRDCRDGNIAAKHHGARGCGALIDGQHKGHDVFPSRLFGVASRVFVVPSRQADWERKVNTMTLYSTLLPSRPAQRRGEGEEVTLPPWSPRRRPQWSGRS